MPLGSARAIDFVREYVGIQESRARWLARLGRAMNEVPELDQAFVAGRLNASQVIELAPVAGAETPVDERLSWIERAAGMSVRELRRAVRAERGRAETAVADPPGDPDEPSPGGWRSIAVPARVAGLWQEALDLARMAAGCHLTQGQAAEMIFAEYLSAAGPTGAEVQATPADSERERLIAEVIAALNRQAEERPRSPEQAGLLGAKGEPPPMPLEQKPAGPPSPMDGPAPEPLPVDCIIHDFKDPHHVGETLVRIAALKTCLRYDLAKLLSVFVRSASPAALGYSDLETYCVERLGFGRRRAERLVRFHSGLEKFPRLATAYLEGRISYTAALLLLQILHPSTEAAWVAWADGMS
ncbi:MAG TPA: hypothetical protein VNM87_14055 [Candidatus Udaeobacter sp.]|nr:hypothetical protein [Candidatus Udaeobacter sp.]